MTAQINEGIVLPSTTITASQTLNTNGYVPLFNQTAITFFVEMTVNGTGQVFRVDELGTARAEASSAPIVGGTEARFVVTNPAKTQYYLAVTNTTTGSGTVYVSAYASGS